jgi:hypothetical protein
MFLNYNPNQAMASAPAEPEKDKPKQPEVAMEVEASPLKNAGPIPAELLKDPYAVEIVPLVAEPAPVVVQPAKFLTQERLIWISAVAVSWAVTAFAVLRALGII